MQKSQFGNAYQDLIDAGWKWHRNLFVSPSGASIDSPTAEEILKLRTNMTVESVKAARGPEQAKGASSAG